jgi:hypothetical protein
VKEHIYTLKTDQAGRWTQVIQRCGNYDVYHLPEYHRLAEEQERVEAVLFVCEVDAVTLAVPLLLRDIEGLPGISSSAYRDATSVYGYPGPISNLQHPPEPVLRAFAHALQTYFESEGIVAAFSRLNPLYDQEAYLAQSGGLVRAMGPTVAIDLSLPPDEQRRQYRTNHKRDIKRAQREGVVCLHDRNWTHLDTFVDIYYDTMSRTNAADYYFFDRSYFARLRELLGDKLHLLVALKDQVVVSGLLVTCCNSIIQYHLGGTDRRYLDLASSKLLFDTVRSWGNEMDARIFHLGGGAGARRDGLFHFKAGFSRLEYQFKVWQMVVNEAVYRELVRQREFGSESGELEAAGDYFPAYRRPT